MKKMVHKGWLYLASIVLSLIGFMGTSSTASAQQILQVLGEDIRNPLVTSQSKTGNMSTDQWSGSWSWNAHSKTLTLKNIDSKKPTSVIRAEHLSDFTVVVEGTCIFSTNVRGWSAIGTTKSNMRIKGARSDAQLFIRANGGSPGVAIGENCQFIMDGCLLKVDSENVGIFGRDYGTGVGIKLQNGGGIEVRGASGAIENIKDYIRVEEKGAWKDLNASYTYARATSDDKTVEYNDAKICYAGTSDPVKNTWVTISPYYPVSVAGLGLHRFRTELTPDKYSVLKSGKVIYYPSSQILTLDNATIEAGSNAAIHSTVSSNPLSIVCKGANRLATTFGIAIYVKGKESIYIAGEGTTSSLELLPGTGGNYPGILEGSESGNMWIGNLDLKVKSNAACLYAEKADKTVTLHNVNASLTTISDHPLISGFKTLTLEGSHIVSPKGAEAKDGTIKLNGKPLSRTTCEIKRSNGPKYKITYDLQIKHGSVKVTNYSGSLSAVPKNTKLKVAATPHSGYHVTKITAGGDDITSTKEFVVTRNAVISAQFAINMYNVTSTTSVGGSISLSKSGSVAHGTQISVTVKPQSGYELTSLMAGSEDILRSKKFTVKGNTTVKAVFSKMGKVTVAPVEHGSIKVTGVGNLNAVPRGTKLTVVASPKEGFELKTLTANGSNILPNKIFTMGDKDVVVKGTFVARTFAVTTVPPVNGTLVLKGFSNLEKVPYGTTIKVEAKPTTGYILVKLTANGEDITAKKEFVVKKATKVEAVFTNKTFVVTAVKPVNGTLTLSGYPDMKKVPYGTTIKVEAKPANGYTLAKLTANGEDITVKKEFVVKRETKVEALFSNETHAVTIAKTVNGTIEVQGAADLKKVAKGAELTVVDKPNEGFTLKTLTANGNDILPGKKFTMGSKDVEIKATFEIQTFLVEAVKPANGTLTLTGSSDLKKVPYGTTIKVDAKPANGYVLVKITANGEDITAKKEFVVKKETKVEALFSQETYAVTITETAHGMIKVQGAADLKKVAKGSELSVVVSPEDGYELDKLFANDQDITATLKFKVEGATTLKATFKQTNGVGEVVEAVVILYPNPATEFATLKGVEAGATVQLFSLNGMEVLRTVADMAGTAHLDLSGLVAGEYLVKSGTTTVRLLITK